MVQQKAVESAKSAKADVDVTSTTLPDYWETYRNNDFGFELLHPTYLLTTVRVLDDGTYLVDFGPSYSDHAYRMISIRIDRYSPDFPFVEEADTTEDVPPSLNAYEERKIIAAHPDLSIDGVGGSVKKIL